tara:strand:- start:616 stop:852 length:237 start_codon:yes stop_codon:yes gene_type:complete
MMMTHLSNSPFIVTKTTQVLELMDTGLHLDHLNGDLVVLITDNETKLDIKYIMTADQLESLVNQYSALVFAPAQGDVQ